MICDRCGHDLQIGDYPFCPHGETGSAAIQDVTWPGGKVFENLGHEPVRCDSPADLKREMKKRNLEPFVRHVDGDKHVSRWVSMSQETLDGAKAMLERVGKGSEHTETGWVKSMTVTVTEETGTVIAPRGTFDAR